MNKSFPCSEGSWYFMFRFCACSCLTLSGTNLDDAVLASAVYELHKSCPSPVDTTFICFEGVCQNSRHPDLWRASGKLPCSWCCVSWGLWEVFIFIYFRTKWYSCVCPLFRLPALLSALPSDYLSIWARTGRTPICKISRSTTMGSCCL